MQLLYHKEAELAMEGTQRLNAPMGSKLMTASHVTESSWKYILQFQLMLCKDDFYSVCLFVNK
jgi:hypothetical protein